MIYCIDFTSSPEQLVQSDQLRWVNDFSVTDPTLITARLPAALYTFLMPVRFYPEVYWFMHNLWCYANEAETCENRMAGKIVFDMLNEF